MLVYVKKYLTSIASLFLITGMAKAQQPFTYTQYMDNTTPLNPAYAMIQKGGSINTMVRKQWIGVDGAPTTYLVNGNLPIESINASAGLIASNDLIGVERLTEVNAFFAKGIKLSDKNNLAVAINAGFRNYVANYSQIDDTDPNFSTDIREVKPNVGFGVLYYTNSYYLGVSVPELNVRDLGTASQQDVTNFRNHYYFTGGISTQLNDDYIVKYYTLVAYTRDIPVIADVSGIFYLKSALGIGFTYRTNNEVAGILKFNFDQYYLGYSYQVGTSTANIGGFNNATHELTFSMRFGKVK